MAKSFGRTLKARKRESASIESHIKIALYKHRNIDDFKYTYIIIMFFRDKKSRKDIKYEAYPMPPSGILSEQYNGTTILLDFGQLGSAQPTNTISSVKKKTLYK